MNTAIVCLAYNRPDSLQRLLTSLDNAFIPEATDLIISIDKGDNNEVIHLAEHWSWTHGQKTTLQHNERLGTRRHVMSLGSLFSKYEALIVLEDDITVAPSFFLYTQACLNQYGHDEHIAGISLYSFNINYQNELPFLPVKSEWDVYLMNCAQSWGEVWTRRQWQAFKSWYDRHSDHFNDPSLPQCLNDWPDSSWLKFHTRYCIEQDLYFVYPYFSLTTNNADTGVNQKFKDSLYQTCMLTGLQREFRLPAFEQANIRYDGFFNPKFLAAPMNLDDKELTIDLYGNKPLANAKRYLLSTRPLPYHVIRCFSMQLKPMEMNIIAHREGNGIWLFDTTQAAPAPKDYDGYALFYHYYGKAFFKTRTMIGLKGIITVIIRTLRHKISNS